MQRKCSVLHPHASTQNVLLLRLQDVPEPACPGAVPLRVARQRLGTPAAPGALACPRVSSGCAFGLQLPCQATHRRGWGWACAQLSQLLCCWPTVQVQVGAFRAGGPATRGCIQRMHSGGRAGRCAGGHKLRPTVSRLGDCGSRHARSACMLGLRCALTDQCHLHALLAGRMKCRFQTRLQCLT